MALPLGLATLALWSPPSSLSSNALVAWIGVALFAFYATHTACNVPHAAWAAELSRAHHRRSRVFAGREIAEKLGLCLALGVIGWLESAGNAREVAL